MSPSIRGLSLLASLFAVVPHVSSAQTRVYPRQAGKTDTRYFQFDWRHADILVGKQTKGAGARPHAVHAPSRALKLDVMTGASNPAFPLQPPGFVIPTSLDERSGGVRLYFYERERVIAERAASSITDTYRKLVDRFSYVPTQTFPYVLYSSYQEFLETNLFPLQEGTLGVTSPTDLKLTLPYFGDHRLFQEVSAHEMVHQFTIQKIRSFARAQGVAGEPIQELPLWFIEGLAEYYAHDGVPAEAEMFTRDIVLNPDPRAGYAMLNFFEDRPASVLWTYKVGVVRCAFLAQEYGEAILQQVLEKSPSLLATPARPAVKDFSALLSQLTGDEPARVSGKFETWIKRRAFPVFLEAGQAGTALNPFEREPSQIDGILTSLATSPDGELVLYRSIEPTTGETRLYLTHRSVPARALRVVFDGVPGVESLHPISERNFDLSDDRLVYVAQTQNRDVLYVHPVGRRVTGVRKAPADTPKAEEPKETTITQMALEVGASRRYDLAAYGVQSAYSPSFSPDGRSLAFVGMDHDGQRDLFLLDLSSGAVRRLTNDLSAERQASWGASGIVFTSDNTSHGHFNLFQVDPADSSATPALTRLTTEANDQFDPLATHDGRVFFTAYDAARANLHEVVDGEVVQRTDVATGLFNASPGPRGGLWALLHRSGQRKAVLLAPGDLADRGRAAQLSDGLASALPTTSLANAQLYNPFSSSNWELGPLVALVGGGTGGILGQVNGSASDKLRNHALLLNVGMYGSFELTDGYLVYMNQESRLTQGLGLFQQLYFRYDRSFEELPFYTVERFFGALASARYPFSRFLYAQADVALGGVSYFLLEDDRALLADGLRNGRGVDLTESWTSLNAGLRPQAEASLRLGHDTLVLHPATGPVTGHSVLLEATVATQPFQDATYGSFRLDAERYFQLGGRSNFFLRVGAGTTFGGRLARDFFLSSFDTLRGVRFGDIRLIGRDFLFSTAEIQIPLNELIRVALLSDLEGIVGVDFGGTGATWSNAWDRRVLNGVIGANLGLGPLVFRLHFAKNVGIGAPAGLPVGPSEWVTNFSIGFAGLGGLLGDRAESWARHQHTGAPRVGW